MKPLDIHPNDIPTPAAREAPTWTVELSARAARVVARYGSEDRDFNPTIKAVIDELEDDPKQFEKKSGKLAGIRAAPLRYRNTAWRMPFVVDDKTRVVLVLTIDRHDAAYRDAAR